MTVKTGQAWAGAFVTLDATGALATPSTGPAGVLYVDGVANGASVTITGSNPYKWAVTLPSLTAGQRVDMYITATISKIATAGFVASEQADTTLLSDGVTLADDAITSAKFDESTAFPVKSADTGATAIARVGADSDTLKTLSDQIDAVKAETASILEDTGTTIPGTITTIDNEIAVIDGIVDSILEDTGTTLDTKINTIDDFLDTEVAAILADTNELQTDWVNGGRLDSLIDAIKTKTDTITTPPTAASVADAVWDEAIADHTTATTFGGKNQKVVPSETIGDYKADVSGLATTTHVQEVEDKVDTIDGNVDAVLLDTGTDGVKIASGELSDLALEATLTAMQGAGWSTETLVALKTAIDNITGGGATAQQIWEYATRTITGLPTMPTDWVTAAGLKADAVTKLQAGLALEATLTAIKGAGWSTETLAAIDVLIDAIKAKTDNLPDSPAAVGSAMTLTAAYDNAKDDVLTPLGVVDGIVDAIKVQTDKIPASPAEAGEYTAAIGAIPTTPLLAANYTAPDNAGIAAIKAKTDNLPASPAPANEYDTELTAIQADLDNPDQYKADVSGLATSSALATVDTVVDGIATTLANPDNFKADVSALALESTLTAMKGAGWTTETLKAIKDAVDAISAGSGASVDQIWNELTATHTTVGSFAKAITDILQDTGTDIPALITALGAWQATNVTTAVSSGSITDIRGSSWSIPITDLTLDANKQQFVIKRNVQDADTAALLFVDSATGLIYINGAAGTAGDATLVYAGTTLTLTVKPGATAQLPVGTFHYGIQSVTAAGAVEEPYGGIFTISGDYVRAIT